MGSRTIAQVAPTAATMAMNAYIYGYGGHSLVTPHAAIKQLWWTDERIDARVTRAWVISKLRGGERDFLDRPLAFGAGLTDDTYMDWILERAKRFFVILADIGVPDQIFGCIDDSWSDDDLPISLEDIAGLELSYERDEVLNRKFYDAQFIYLLRELKKGDHIDYGPREHIPMELVNSVPPAVAIQTWDRVHFPNRAEDIYMRRRFVLLEKDSDHDYSEAFSRDLNNARILAHPHIAPIWASYTADGSAFTLSDFVGEHTLQTFIDHRTPTQWMRVAAAERPARLCGWMHCLADTLAFLHHRGVAHTAIRPSNVIIDRDNRIAFADVGSLRFLQRGKKTASRTEVYDYAAPESHISLNPFRYSGAMSPPPSRAGGTFSQLRKLSNASSAHSDNSSSRSSVRSSSVLSTTPLSRQDTGVRNFSRHLISPAPPSSSSKTSHNSNSSGSASGLSSVRQSTGATSSLANEPLIIRDRPVPTAGQSDVFSLACLYLDIVTYMLKGKTTDFVKHRRTRAIYSDGSKSGKSIPETSFHASPDLIDSWMTILEAEATKKAAVAQGKGSANANNSQFGTPTAIYASVPAMLMLVRRMMAHNSMLRPSAREVRDELRDILSRVSSTSASQAIQIRDPPSTSNLPCNDGVFCCEHAAWEDGDSGHHAVTTDKVETKHEPRRDNYRKDDKVLIEESESDSERLGYDVAKEFHTHPSILRRNSSEEKIPISEEDEESLSGIRPHEFGNVTSYEAQSVGTQRESAPQGRRSERDLDSRRPHTAAPEMQSTLAVQRSVAGNCGSSANSLGGIGGEATRPKSSRLWKRAFLRA